MYRERERDTYMSGVGRFRERSGCPAPVVGSVAEPV